MMTTLCRIGLLCLALPSVAAAKPSFTSRAAGAVLDEGLTVSGVSLQRKRAKNGAKRVESCMRADREQNLPALWVGLQVRSGQQQVALQLDLFRLATSALPGGRSIRSVASGAMLAWDLLEPAIASSAHRLLVRRHYQHHPLFAHHQLHLRLLAHPAFGHPRRGWAGLQDFRAPHKDLFDQIFWPYDFSQDEALRRLVHRQQLFKLMVVGRKAPEAAW